MFLDKNKTHNYNSGWKFALGPIRDVDTFLLNQSTPNATVSLDKNKNNVFNKVFRYLTINDQIVRICGHSFIRIFFEVFWGYLSGIFEPFGIFVEVFLGTLGYFGVF